MKKQTGMSKSGAFIFGMVCIMTTFVFDCVINRAVNTPPTLTAIVSLVTLYCSVQTVNNGVKGKYFHEGLLDK
ncbi:hypothetical protein FACS1894190_09900 [Spirochaetia bacterium]|nr:hypothetical protein FACS1894190_09900 [Spirochaetia bacterium]